MTNVNEGEAKDVDDSLAATTHASPVVYEDHAGKDYFNLDSEFDNLINLKGFTST